MRSEDADLVAVLHRDFGQFPVGQGFLARLSARTSAQAAAVIITPSGPDQTTISCHHPQISPLPSADTMQRMRFLRVSSAEDFPHPRPFRAIRVRIDAGGEAVLVLQKDGADFAASTSALLTLLAENLAVAAQTALSRRLDGLGAGQTADMLARLGLAWVLVEWQVGAPVVLSHSGAAALPLVQSGRMRLPPAMQRRLSDSLPKSRLEPIAMQEAGLQYLALPAPSPHRAVIYVQGARAASGPDATTLAAFTGLTPAEARFVHQLALGQTIAQAGAALNLTPDTARYYSKQAYAKLGLPNQTAVVQMIASSVLRLL